MDISKAKQLSELMSQFDILIKNYKDSFKEIIKQCNISISYDHIMILLLLNKKQGISQKELSRRLCKDPASSSRMLKYLISNNFVQKTEDGKFHKLYLTPKSYDIVEKIEPAKMQHLLDFFIDVYDKELGVMSSVMNRMTKKGDTKKYHLLK